MPGSVPEPDGKAPLPYFAGSEQCVGFTDSNEICRGLAMQPVGHHDDGFLCRGEFHERRFPVGQLGLGIPPENPTYNG
jgi:hypothetical protein